MGHSYSSSLDGIFFPGNHLNRFLAPAIAAILGAIADLPNFHWLILTSANAVTFFLDRLLEQGQDLRALVGLMPDYMPPDFVADALVTHFPEAVAGQRLLFPRVESGGREVLVQEFTAAGAEVVEVAAYESGCPASPDPEALAALKQGRVE